jgi:hypothetical protein
VSSLILGQTQSIPEFDDNQLDYTHSRTSKGSTISGWLFAVVRSPRHRRLNHRRKRAVPAPTLTHRSTLAQSKLAHSTPLLSMPSIVTHYASAVSTPPHLGPPCQFCRHRLARSPPAPPRRVKHEPTRSPPRSPVGQRTTVLSSSAAAAFACGPQPCEARPVGAGAMRMCVGRVVQGG